MGKYGKRTAIVGELPECDFCNDGTTALFDFRTVYGQWGFGCEDCWEAYRASTQLGEGIGQRLVVTVERSVEDKSEKLAFIDWMKEVDKLLVSACGEDHTCLPDAPYRMLYEANTDAEVASQVALEMAASY